MRLVVVVSLCLLFNPAAAQKQYNVFDWKAEYTLNTYLVQQVHQQYDQRNTALQKALQSGASLQAYRDSCRMRYRKLLGKFPAAKSLNARITGTIQEHDYRIEKIIYESLPDHHVTANLYVPSGKGPFPAVLLFCGHEAESKATESYQKTAILFALHGFVVLVVDPIAQGERYQLTNAAGKPSTRGGTTEHTLINAAANLTGSGAVAYELWDNVRGLDYLITRTEVDQDRIGCLGNSGGGTQTTYFIGFDDRIKVAAPCSYIARRERNLELIGASDGCQHIPFEGREQLEINDFLIMFAPKPLLILAGRYDFVDYTGTQSAYQELRQVYTVFGAADKVDLFTVDDGHGISAPKREAAVSWFKRWLCHDHRPVREDNLQTHTPKELMCTVTGQVNSSYTNEVNDVQRTLALARDLVTKRKQPPPDLPVRIRKVLNIQAPVKELTAEAVGIVEQAGYAIHKIILRREGDVPLPLLAVYPQREVKQVILWLHDGGKYKIADSTILLQKYIQEQSAVVMADLRGVGETADPVSFNDPKYFNREYRNAMTALHIGRPLPGQRVTDIINILDFIDHDKRSANAKIRLIAAGGISALSALHAAVLDHRITQLTMQHSLSSFLEIIEKPLIKDWYSYVIPGVLNRYDLPDLIADLQKRKVIL